MRVGGRADPTPIETSSAKIYALASCKKSLLMIFGLRWLPLGRFSWTTRRGWPLMALRGRERPLVSTGTQMRTQALAFLCILVGLISFIAGLVGAGALLLEGNEVEFQYYAAATGLMLAGLALCGVGQGLRLLLDINTRGTS